MAYCVPEAAHAIAKQPTVKQFPTWIVGKASTQTLNPTDITRPNPDLLSNNLHVGNRYHLCKGNLMQISRILFRSIPKSGFGRRTCASIEAPTPRSFGFIEIDRLLANAGDEQLILHRYLMRSLTGLHGPQHLYKRFS